MALINPKIFNYLRAFKQKMLIMASALLLFEMLKLVPPFVFAMIIDKLVIFTGTGVPEAQHIDWNNWFNVWQIPGARVIAELIGVFFIASIIAHVCEYFVERFSTKVYCQIHTQLLYLASEKLLSLDLGYHENHNSARQVAQLHRGVDRLMHLMFEVHDQLVPTLFQLVLTFIVITSLSWSSGLAFVLIVPFFLYYTIWMAKTLQPLRLYYHQIETNAAGNLGENIMNVRTVQDYGREQEALAKQRRLLKEFLRNFIKRCRFETNHKFWRDLILATARVAVMIFYILMVLRDNISPGLLVLFVTLTEKSYLSLYRIGRIFDRSADSLEGINLMLNLFEQKQQVKDADDACQLINVKGKVEFNGVKFKYNRSAELVLKGISFEVPAKNMLALVGRSGSGKSTIIKLLFRHFDLADGQILIDGQNIAEVTRSSLREQMAIVAQDVEIFNTSVLENIRYGNLEATEDDVIKAAKIAHCHEFISNFKDGYNTVVGERGVKLSGGQKQRIGIARAIIKKPKILVFDEATSSLDSESEKLIQDAMWQVAKECTLIVIAHRLSTIEHADQIVVIENGKIIESGDHDELVAKKGVFAQMRKLQDSGEIRD